MSNFTVKSDGAFERHLPSEGLVEAVVVDVIDVGYETTEWAGEEKTQHKLTVVWEVNEAHPNLDGPFRIYKKFTNSLHEKSNLGKALESIRGKKFTDDERREGFDMLKLVGVPCRLLIQHEESKNGNTYAKIGAFMPTDKATSMKPSGYYTPSLKEASHISAYALLNGVDEAKVVSETAAASPGAKDDMAQAVLADDDLPF